MDKNAHLTLYKISTVKNCIKLYMAMYLNNAKLVTRAHRPSNMRCFIHEISLLPEVNGAATLASAWLRDTPICAAFSACTYKKIQIRT